MSFVETAFVNTIHFHVCAIKEWEEGSGTLGEGQGGEVGTSYLLKFFVSGKLHSNIGDDSGHIGSVPLEITSEAFLSPNAHQRWDNASKLLTHTIYLDLCVCVCVGTGGRGYVWLVFM